MSEERLDSADCDDCDWTDRDPRTYVGGARQHAAETQHEVTITEWEPRYVYVGPRHAPERVQMGATDGHHVSKTSDR